MRLEGGGMTEHADFTKLEKRDAVLGMLARLEKRLGRGTFLVVDHWEGDLDAIGVADPRNPSMDRRFMQGGLVLAQPSAPAVICGEYPRLISYRASASKWLGSPGDRSHRKVHSRFANHSERCFLALAAGAKEKSANTVD
jgi:hypothetical protein